MQKGNVSRETLPLIYGYIGRTKHRQTIVSRETIAQKFSTPPLLAV